MVSDRNKQIGMPKPETEQEKKLRYSQRKAEVAKRERELRAQEKRENRENDRRLAFLANTIRAMGYTKSEIAAKIGLTQQALSWIFSVKDDCKLSLAKEILDSIDLTLSVEIRKQEIAKTTSLKLQQNKSGKNQGVPFVIEGDIIDTPFGNTYSIPSYISKCPEDSNMYFLAKHIIESQVPTNEILKNTDLDYTGLRYIFTKDDIRISHIYQIARSTGGEIVWKINRK